MVPAPAPIRCRLDDAVARTALEATGYQRSVEATRLSDVIPALVEVEEATRAGLIAVGVVAYEAAPAFDAALIVASPSERDDPGALPSAATAVPLVWFGLFDDLVPAPIVSGNDAQRPPCEVWEWETDQAGFGADVVKVHEHIAGGMTYQVNLTTRLRRRFAGDLRPTALAMYRQLVAAQGGAYNAYIETPEWAIASGTPELFFSLSGRSLTSKPMKGTARRGLTPAEDDLAAVGLAGSPKERAENVMIVDLMRNDLSRVANVGTVEVGSLFELERYRTVWQMTSTVTCEVPAEVRLVSLFEALFPAGSVTGAPKPSTMSIIASLERSVRGPYCGAIGLVGGGAMQFGVGIRTAVLDLRSSVIEFGIGSGVTWYANADDEWAELGAKATVLGAGPPYSAAS